MIIKKVLALSVLKLFQADFQAILKKVDQIDRDIIYGDHKFGVNVDGREYKVELKKLSAGFEAMVLLFQVEVAGQAQTFVLRTPNFGGDEYNPEKFRRNSERWQLLDHPNIVKLYYTDRYAYQVMEYVPEQISKEITGDDLFQEFLPALLSMLYYCHSRNLAHTDLKLANMGIGYDEKTGKRVLKVFDLGDAVSFDKKQEDLGFCRMDIKSVKMILENVCIKEDVNENYSEMLQKVLFRLDNICKECEAWPKDVYLKTLETVLLDL
jgi:serine/threonine protein kinase